MDKIREQLRRLRVNLVREADKFRRKLLAPSHLRELPPEYPQDFSEFTRTLCARVRGRTMTSQARIANLELAVRYIVRHGIEGALVECGVGAGGSMMAAAWTLLACGADSRDLYLFDTYRGMPAPGPEDMTFLGKSGLRKFARKQKTGSWHDFPLDGVRANMATTRYPAQRIHYIEGLVQETLPRQRIERIALLRLDTNLYESTAAELHHLYPRLAPGGVLIIDDYNKWMGQRQAVDEYFAAHGVRMLLMRIDDHAVQGIKT